MREKGFAPIIVLLVLVVIALMGIAYLAGTKSSALNLNKITPSPTALDNSVNPTSEKVKNLINYKNDIQKYSFQYPAGWLLNDSQASMDPNSFVELKKGEAKISIYANMDGIGGRGMDYEGSPIKLSGLDLYKYEVETPETKTTTIGLTDTLTESLGFFQNNGKTYSISLKYPSSSNVDEGNMLKNDFEMIISTFKFD